MSSEEGSRALSDLGFEPPVTGRIDAMRDLKIEWKWQGVGRSPEPTVKPGAVDIDGHHVDLYWPERGWGVSRLFMICPVCSKRSRHLYALQHGGFGCNRHVSSERVAKENALLALRRARVLQRNHRYRRRGQVMEQNAKADLVIAALGL